MPDPRFRDQLAGWLFDFSMKARGVAARWADPSIGIQGDDGAELLSDRVLRAAWRSEADRLIEDVIAAEVDARVQAAANQARAEELLFAADMLERGATASTLRARAAALASPASAPRVTAGSEAGT